MIADKIFTVLQSRTPRTLGEERLRPAAVLVPIQERADGDHLVLTQRAAMLSSHQGQVAFPGGRVDQEDSGPLQAALRESEEEIGIRPRDVRVLGQLDQVTAAADYLVTPFVGVIPFPYEFRLNPAETTAVFSVPVSALLDPERLRMEARPYLSSRRDPIYHFHYEGWDIWGATARIITQLLELAYGFEIQRNVD
ncbi:MAG: CoA pyrophosphatase [Deltaproteobacteria bacterium]|nr:CoA pyrophosphatase [Deltaproteobacteria bacterium]